jgi:hypothetical protein
MSNLEQRRSRYLQDNLPIRLGGLAANLSRIASFSKHDGVGDVVLSILWDCSRRSPMIPTEKSKRKYQSFTGSLL